MPLIGVSVKRRRTATHRDYSYLSRTTARYASRTCGVFVFTYAAEFPLHTTWPLQRITPAELIYEPCQLQQIRHAEDRTMAA